MIEQVRERGRHRVVVLAGDDHVRVGGLDEASQMLEQLRRAARRILLVHLVEDRQRVLERIDERDLVAALAALGDDEAGRADAAAGRPHGAVENEQVELHGGLKAYSGRPRQSSR